MERFPKVHVREHDPNSFSYSDGSAKKTGGGQQADGGLRSESIGTVTGTGYTGVIMAHTHQDLRIDPSGKGATNTINRAELVGVLSWLEEIVKEELATGSTFQLLTDSQVTLQSIQKAIKQSAATWLNTQEPVLMDIVTLKGWHDLSISALPSYPPYFHLICGLHPICPFSARISHVVDLIFPIRRHLGVLSTSHLPSCPSRSSHLRHPVASRSWTGISSISSA